MEGQMLFNIGVTLGGIVLANYGAKFGRFTLILTDILKYASDYKKSKEDNILTVKEKAALYDDIDKILESAKSVLKGFFPNKSK